jgi:hypothetical protein
VNSSEAVLHRAGDVKLVCFRNILLRCGAHPPFTASGILARRPGLVGSIARAITRFWSEVSPCRARTMHGKRNIGFLRDRKFRQGLGEVIDSGKAGGKRGRKLRVVAEARFNYFIDRTFESRGRADWNRSQVVAAYSAVHCAVADGKSFQPSTRVSCGGIPG